MPLPRGKSRQLELEFPKTWGGKRTGAGRKPRKGARTSVPHRPRAAHRAAHPVHVTMRARDGLPPFREEALFGAIRDAIRHASHSRAVGGAFRVVHFSVQRDHLHLIVEAHDRSFLSRGMQGLAVRVARAVNRVLRARGRVIGERFHAHELRTPREVRNALVYVLMNVRKHARQRAPALAIDGFSSAPWFDGFREAVGPPPAGERPVVRPRTWLASTGWRRRGLIGLGEAPFKPEPVTRAATTKR